MSAISNVKALSGEPKRMGGPSGVTAKLGIPRETLESKIQRLGIDKDPVPEDWFGPTVIVTCLRMSRRSVGRHSAGT